MDPIRDPEGVEIAFLRRTGAVHGRKVIEIGSGNGRLTWRYANLAPAVAGVDPDFAQVAAAVTTRPETVQTPLLFTQAEAGALPFPAETFESAILAWSL